MNTVYITKLMIDNVRHLQGIEIPLASDKKKHLIITGRNGSGKTSVLDAISSYLDGTTGTDLIRVWEGHRKNHIECLNGMTETSDKETVRNVEKNIELCNKKIQSMKQGVELTFNCSLSAIYDQFQEGELIVAYYRSERIFQAVIPRHVEKVELKQNYTITERPRESFVKYLLDLKMTEALAVTGGKVEKANKIKLWFEKFQNMLQKIFSDPTLTLQFDEDTFSFYICQEGKVPFDFNSLSSGYAAVLDIVVDIIIRMEKQTNRTLQFDMAGIVLIDEIETHLHLELQKRILELLTTMFPNIQFIISTHSPFVLNSLENVVIYDLENHLLVENGLVDLKSFYEH